LGALNAHADFNSGWKNVVTANELIYLSRERRKLKAALSLPGTRDFISCTAAEFNFLFIRRKFK
jgi:hypothetical protein